MTDFVLRDARRDDVASVVAIERASFPDPWTADAFRRCITHAHDIFIVAEGADGTIAGYAIVRGAAGAGELIDIAVAPGHRGRGIGGALLDTMVARAGDIGIPTLTLEVRESNAPAIALYQSRGFDVVGARRGYYTGPREDALVMLRRPPSGNDPPPRAERRFGARNARSLLSPAEESNRQEMQ